MDSFVKVEAYLKEVEETILGHEEEIEAFRIKYLGTKNILKSVFEEIRQVPNEQKKAFGQLCNAVKSAAETKFYEAKSKIDQAKLNQFEKIDLTAPSPVQVRTMKAQEPPIRMIAPGRVYRNETISARSHCQFHQIEGLYIAEGVSFADLRQTLSHFASEMFGATQIRLRPSYFPFTEPSAEMDVYLGLETERDQRLTKGTGWLEVLGCGMVDPVVLSQCGIDPEKYTGFAFGIGVERIALFRYQIDDIRLFFENDTRFLRQFRASHTF